MSSRVTELKVNAFDSDRDENRRSDYYSLQSIFHHCVLRRLERILRDPFLILSPQCELLAWQADDIEFSGAN